MSTYLDFPWPLSAVPGDQFPALSGSGSRCPPLRSRTPGRPGARRQPRCRSNNDGTLMLLSRAGQPQRWPMDVTRAATMGHRCGAGPGGTASMGHRCGDLNRNARSAGAAGQFAAAAASRVPGRVPVRANCRSCGLPVRGQRRIARFIASRDPEGLAPNPAPARTRPRTRPGPNPAPNHPCDHEM